MPDISPEVKNIVATLGNKVYTSLKEGNQAEVLKWAGEQKEELLIDAIKSTQPRGWDVAIEPLLTSQSPDQRAAMLCALIAVFVQCHAPKA